MRTTLMAGANVVRFPAELRAKPSLGLLYEIAPDVREVGLVAEAFGMEEPAAEIRDDADRQMSYAIKSRQWPQLAAERDAALDALLKPLVERAIGACREAEKAARRSDDAAEKLVNAQTEGGYWLDPLEQASTLRATEAAALVLEAYVAFQQTSGAARAIRLAKSGEEWRPFDLETEAEQLFFGAPAARGWR